MARPRIIGLLLALITLVVYLPSGQHDFIVYDDPEYVVRNIWRLYGGWWDGVPAHLQPASHATVAREVATLAGGVDALVARARVPIRIEQDPARMRASDVPILVGNPRRLQEATGWQPKVSFDQMIDDLLDYWRKQP